MVTNPNVRGTGPANTLFDQVMSRVDTNGDGQLNAAEFKSFLGDLLGAATARRGDTAAPAAASTDGPSAVRQYLNSLGGLPGGPRSGVLQREGSNAPTREMRDQLTWSGVGRMEGFEVGSSYGGDLKARNSVKNTFGRIASRYPSQPSSIDRIMADPDFQAAFPNARRLGFDKIDFGGVMSDFESGSPVGVVDVLTSADPTLDVARGWAWQPD
jgi:hypothetical protein